MDTRQHRSARAFINGHAVLTFYALVFALIWGPTLILGAVVGTTDFLHTQPELTSAADVDPFLYVTMLAGPLIIALAGILVIALAFGRAGLRELRSRVTRWRVSVPWYAVVLLTAPLLWTAILGAMSLISKTFLPDIITADDKASLVAAGLVAGVVAGFFEEIGWTGLATAELSKRHGLLATGLIVGLPWCMLHVPLYLRAASGAVPQALNVTVILLFTLLPYRVLMVWVYRRTCSVLMVMVMHLAIVVCVFVFDSSAVVGVPGLVFNLVFGGVLWGLVAAVAAADRQGRSRWVLT
jgi:membrane protease YdiL (CAAX protease family)